MTAPVFFVCFPGLGNSFCNRQFATHRVLNLHRFWSTRCQGQDIQTMTEHAPSRRREDIWKGGGAVDIKTRECNVNTM